LTVARAKFMLSRFGPLPEIRKVCHWMTARVGVARFADGSRKVSGEREQRVCVGLLTTKFTLDRALDGEPGRKIALSFATALM
jgi:hypothetical protein